MPERLTFIIDTASEFSSFDLLFKSIEDIRRLLRDVDYAMYRRKPRDEWIVHSVKSSAPTITVTPNRADQEAVNVIGEGLRNVTSGTDQPPQHFTEKVLEDLKKMRRLFRGKARAHSMSVLMDEERIAVIGEDIHEQVDRILSYGYYNLGSLEGTLEAINVHGRAKVTIWDRVSRSPVSCSIPKDNEWIDHVKRLLQKRVTVKGNIRYFVNGVPRSISKIVEIEDATPDPNLPRAEFGSIPNRSVLEVGAAEWLKSIRGVFQE
jgi:hypothetical protein